MKTAIRSVFILIALLSGFATFACRDRIQVSDARDLSGTFLDTASLIFAIIGAWLALFFPKYFEQMFATESGRATPDRKNIAMLRALLVCLLLSGAVILLNLSVAYLGPYREVIVNLIGRTPSLCLLLGCCWLSFIFLAYCLISALAPAVVVLVQDARQESEAARRARKQGRSE